MEREEDPNLKEILISRKTAESVLRGASIYAPGILAASSGLSPGDPVAVHVANEEETITRGSLISPGWCSEKKCLFIGRGLLHMSRAELFRSLSGLAITLTRAIFQSPAFNGVLLGKIMLQNLPSIVTAKVLNPKPGSKVLDMCAAPGGKTTAIAELMRNEGTVIALDRTHKKVKRIVDLAKELGITCITAYKMDATKLLFSAKNKKVQKSQDRMTPKEMARSQRKENFRIQCKQAAPSPPVIMPEGKGFHENHFDAVLLDAPCSALGLRPRLHFPHTLAELEETARYQRKLLDAAVTVLKEGGTLVYSTCTINPLENEAHVRYALDHHPCLKLQQQDPILGKGGLTGSKDGGEQWLSLQEASMVQRFDPCDEEQDTIGFFIAKFTKRAVITDIEYS